MTATTQRHAAPNTTPVSSVLGHEERITRLERDNADLEWTIKQLVSVISELNCRTYGLQNLLRINTAVDIAHNDRLTKLEGTRQGDMRLTDVLAGIEARLARVEIGGEVLP